MVHTAAGAPGWSDSSSRDVSPQRPDQAPSTSSEGSIYVTGTFQVSDGEQCGGTGGALLPRILCLLTIICLSRHIIEASSSQATSLQ